MAARMVRESPLFGLRRSELIERLRGRQCPGPRAKSFAVKSPPEMWRRYWLTSADDHGVDGSGSIAVLEQRLAGKILAIAHRSRELRIVELDGLMYAAFRAKREPEWRPRISRADPLASSAHEIRSRERILVADPDARALESDHRGQHTSPGRAGLRQSRAARRRIAGSAGRRRACGDIWSSRARMSTTDDSGTVCGRPRRARWPGGQREGRARPTRPAMPAAAPASECAWSVTAARTRRPAAFR